MKENMNKYFKRGQIWECYKFAREMKGKHNPNMIMERKDWEIFRDDFRGKLGEFAVRNYFDDEVETVEYTGAVDLSVTERGQWDRFDLKVDDKILSIKSVKAHSRFLMIETSRFDNYGNYSYTNPNGEKITVDYYVLVCVDIVPEIQEDDLNYRNIYEFWTSKNNRRITAKILGILSHEEFWKIKHTAPEGMRCNVQNLENLCRNETVDMSPGTRTTDFLQRENYIVDGRNEMFPIEHYFQTEKQ